MSTDTAAPTNVRFRIVGVSMLMAFILYLDRVCLGEIVKSDSFARDVAISDEELGLVLSAFFYAYALFQIPTGWASDRFGARKILTAYIVLWSLSTALTGLMSTFAGLLALRLLCGAAEAGAYPTSGSVIRRWIPIDRRARASAAVAFYGRVGGALAPVITTWMVIQLGHWRRPLWVDGAVGLLIAALYWHVIRDRPEEHPDCNAAERNLIGHPPNEPPVPTREFFGMFRTFCRDRNLWLNGLGQFCTNVGWAFLVTWLPKYLKKDLHVPDEEGAMMVTLVLACGMLGQLTGGYMADWCVRRFGLRRGRVLPLFVSGTLGGIAYLVSLRQDTPWGLVACFCCVSFSVDLGNPATWAFMQDIGGRATAAAFGWGNMWGNLGAGVISQVAPLIVAAGATPALGQRNVFLLCTAALFLYGLISLCLDATKSVIKPLAVR